MTRPAPVLIIVCGLPGVGKTTVATKIAAKTGATLLRTDTLRRQLISAPRYTEEEKERVYAVMFAGARGELQRAANVVLDATFSTRARRAQARKLARQCGAGFRVVVVSAAEHLVKARLEARVGDDSEAGYLEYLKSREGFEPVTEGHLVIDNSGRPEAITGQIDLYF